jgi:hypothetical protein
MSKRPEFDDLRRRGGVALQSLSSIYRLYGAVSAVNHGFPQEVTVAIGSSKERLWIVLEEQFLGEH